MSSLPAHFRFQLNNKDFSSVAFLVDHAAPSEVFSSSAESQIAGAFAHL